MDEWRRSSGLPVVYNSPHTPRWKFQCSYFRVFDGSDESERCVVDALLSAAQTELRGQAGSGFLSLLTSLI